MKPSISIDKARVLYDPAYSTAPMEKDLFVAECLEKECMGPE